ncbi:MAG: hypothetical protein QGG50_01015 [Methanopyri archaeon]|jgi:hypothetical protein|nr:hypothetical protein [Methanopyri archaeon]
MTLTWLEKREMGDDLLLLLGGGATHIGCVAVCEPGEEPRSIALPGHKEDVVAAPLARAVASRTGRRVAVVAGIHYDEISSEQIQQVIDECKGYEVSA